MAIRPVGKYRATTSSANLDGDNESLQPKGVQEGNLKPLTFLAVGILSVTMVGQQSGIGKAQIAVPNVKGALEFDVGPTRWEAQVRPDGKETQLRALDRHRSFGYHSLPTEG
jgi:hypothetical protein